MTSRTISPTVATSCRHPAHRLTVTAIQIASGNGLNLGAILEAGAVAAITAGLTNGITYNSTTGSLGLGNRNQGLDSLPQNVSTLGQLTGISNIGSALAGTVTQAGETVASSLPEELAALGATATISAAAQTAIEGGSFLTNLENSAVSYAAAVGAYAIGDSTNPLTLQNIAGHALLGCAASAVEGDGCAVGAIGAAASAAATLFILDGVDPNGEALTPEQSWHRDLCGS